MTRTKKPLLRFRGSGFFFGFLSGLLLVAGYPPWNLWPLQLFALVPLFLALGASESDSSTLWAFFACGLGAIGVGYSWMTSFSEWSGAVSYAFWGFLVLYQSAFFLLIGLSFLVARRFFGKTLALLVVPFAWTAFEHLATYGPFGIPEWLGHGQLHDRLLHPLAASFGVNGLSFFVALVGLAVSLGINETLRSSRAFFATLAVLSALLLGSWAVSLAMKPQESAKSAKVVLLQPAIDPAVLNDGTRGQEVLDAYVNQTRSVLNDGPAPDLVFWSEMVFPYSFNEPGPTRRKMAEALADYPGELVLGGPEKTGGDYFNAAYLVSGGEIEGVYRKMRLFPFGEYTPLRGLLSFVRKDLPQKLRALDYSFGTSAEPLNARAGRIGFSICFESVYADFIRKEVEGGAQLLANLTNDGWFAGSAVVEHHLFVGSMRAVENGRYFLQIASSGLSAVVDPEGRAIRRSTPDQSSILRADVPLMTGHTLFTRLGYWRFAVLAGINFLLLAASKERGSEAPKASRI